MKVNIDYIMKENNSYILYKPTGIKTINLPDFNVSIKIPEYKLKEDLEGGIKPFDVIKYILECEICNKLPKYKEMHTKLTIAKKIISHLVFSYVEKPRKVISNEITFTMKDF